MNEFSIYPGPMEGVMHPVTVRAINALELAPCWVTPFFRVSQQVPKAARLAEFLAPFEPERRTVYCQFTGTDGILIGGAARLALELGCAGINLNFACPSRLVTGSGAGGAALRDPAGAARLLAAVRAELGETADLSVKLRLGWSDWRECETMIPTLAAAAKIQRFFIHFRTVTEQYRTVPGRGERLTRAVELAAEIPVVVNGDVTTVADAQELVRRTRAHGVMIARGWLRDPWLLRRLAGDPTEITPEAARRKLFDAAAVSGGKRIELARMIFGETRWRAIVGM